MKLIDSKIISKLNEEAKNAPRKRAHYNLHPNLDDKIHRLCIAIEPGSYVRPHRHLLPMKWELLVILQGKVDILIFDNDKKVTGRYSLDSEGDIKCLELDANSWHTFASMKKNSVLMEVKQGPYSYPSENDSCQWAPKEGENGTVELEKWFRKAAQGDVVPEHLQC